MYPAVAKLFTKASAHDGFLMQFASEESSTSLKIWNMILGFPVQLLSLMGSHHLIND